MTDVEQSFVSSLEIPDDLPVSGIRITDQERELASQAQIEFENCRYEKSVDALDSLSEIRQNDHKVMHNKAVAQFCHSEFTKTDEFYKNLLSIKKQVKKTMLLYCVGTSRGLSRLYLVALLSEAFFFGGGGLGFF